MFGWLFTVSNMSLTPWYHIKWSGIVENSAGKQKKKKVMYSCFTKLWLSYWQRVKGKTICMKCGLKLGKFLYFYILHWADIISKDAHKCSISLDNSFACYAHKNWDYPRSMIYLSVAYLICVSVIYLIIVLLNSLNSKNVKYEIGAKKARKSVENRKKTWWRCDVV